MTSKSPSESPALREVRRALRWLKRAEKSLAAQERRERKMLRLKLAAQAACQSVGGSNPAATREQHAADLRNLSDVLGTLDQP